MAENGMIIDFMEYMKDKEIKSDADYEKHFSDFLQQQGIDPDDLREEEYNDEESSYDYLEMAQSASSAREALKYAKKALELEPENWDAAVMVAQISAKSPEALLEKLEKLIEQADKVMERDGWFSEEYIGEFWGFFETRPYMRLRCEYLNTLIDCAMLRKAVVQAEEMLRLSENDNLGVRYGLLHLYVHFEEEEAALRLYEKYQEQRSMILLPLSILYYKLGDLKKAVRYLKKAKAVNPDTMRFFDALINGEAENVFEEMEDFGYRPGTIQEYVIEFQQNTFLFGQAASYFSWGYQKLKTMK